MKVKKETERKTIRIIVQYTDGLDFEKDYIKRIKAGWELKGTYNKDKLSFIYERTEREKIVFVEPTLD